MALANNPRSDVIQTLGNNDSSVSERLKVWIMQGSSAVIGLQGEGGSLELDNHWDSLSEFAAEGSVVDKAQGLLQIGTERTKMTNLHSAQVWHGAQPLTMNLNLEFYALSDPVKEVEEAVKTLRKFASPQLNAVSPVSYDTGAGIELGRIPSAVTVSLGRNIIFPDMLIDSVSESLDGLKDKNGNRVKASVSLVLRSEEVLNRSDI